MEIIRCDSGWKAVVGSESKFFLTLSDAVRWAESVYEGWYKDD